MIKILLVFFLLLAFFHAVFNQTLDTAKLDQLFDRLSDKGAVIESRQDRVID
jgi:hypothetical protein